LRIRKQAEARVPQHRAVSAATASNSMESTFDGPTAADARPAGPPAGLASSVAASFDAYAPVEVAARVRAFGVTKARLPLLSLVLLGLLAGAYIGLGSLMFTLVAADGTLGFAVSRFAGGLVFSLGLLMITVAGAELFTGNNLLAMAWADGQVSTRELLHNWTVVCAANAAGAAGLAVLVYWSGHGSLQGGAVGQTIARIAIAKAELPLAEAFFRGVLCNLLVCMAVWMSQAARSVTDKAVAIVFPITGFVAAGFEHSIANMYFFPLAALLGAPIDGLQAAGRLAIVIAGNLLGGSVLVALVYRMIYRRPAPFSPPG
jgi:formate transporter